AIIQHQTEQHALSTQLCHEAGLRAHELYTLRPSGEVNPSPRDVHQDKFSQLPNDSKTYTVEGKGGLIREVQIPNHLAEKLEERRLDTPQQISDRGVNYESHYNIAGGHKFSDAFSKASSRALGFSNGAHGLRHSYAQNRYEQLANHFERIDVMTIISQELGHFRPDITEVYLR
ncbi:site-specific integrase, partial [Vibrio parahaemolyticus]|nr:site-specific integrase [Vibrio parahaemolyticus]